MLRCPNNVNAELFLMQKLLFMLMLICFASQMMSMLTLKLLQKMLLTLMIIRTVAEVSKKLEDIRTRYAF